MNKDLYLQNIKLCEVLEKLSIIMNESQETVLKRITGTVTHENFLKAETKLYLKDTADIASLFLKELEEK